MCLEELVASYKNDGMYGPTIDNNPQKKSARLTFQHLIHHQQKEQDTMGRELQKKKRRANRQPVRQPNRSKKVLNPRGNSVIAKNWYVLSAL